MSARSSFGLLEETKSRRKDRSLSPARPRSLPTAEQTLYRLNNRTFTGKIKKRERETESARKEKVSSTKQRPPAPGTVRDPGAEPRGPSASDWTGGGAEARGRGLCPRSLIRGPLIWICGNVGWSGPAAVPAFSLTRDSRDLSARASLWPEAGGASWPAS